MEQGCINPLCELLTVMDVKIVQVALNGLENILRLGEQDSKLHGGTNPYAVMIEQCFGRSMFCASVSLYWKAVERQSVSFWVLILHVDRRERATHRPIPSYCDVLAPWLGRNDQLVDGSDG